MNMMSHFFTGILIQTLVFHFLPVSFWSWLLIIVIAIGSHYITDTFSWITYHPHLPQKQDPFYNIEQRVVSIIILITFVYFTFFSVEHFHFISSLADPNCYFLSMGAAWLVDLVDWVFIRGLIHFGKIDKKYWDDCFFHRTINVFRAKFFPWVPDRRLIKSGVLIEVLYDLLMIGGTLLIRFI
jgi:hypothetical protein